MKYGAQCISGCSWQDIVPRSFGAAATAATIHEHKAKVLAICPNCGQWRRDGDCTNRCAARLLAPKAGPKTLNL